MYLKKSNYFKYLFKKVTEECIQNFLCLQLDFRQIKKRKIEVSWWWVDALAQGWPVKGAVVPFLFLISSFRLVRNPFSRKVY